MPGRRTGDDPERTVRLPGLTAALRTAEKAPPITGPGKADPKRVEQAAARVIRNRT